MRGLLVSIALLIPAAIFAAAGAGNSPRAEISPVERDLGAVAADDVATAEFTAVNRGTAPLEITAAPAPDTRAILPNAPIAPGANAPIRIEVGTTERTGPSVVAIDLHTNDPEHPTVRLKISLDVRVSVLADPGFARYNFVQGGRSGTVREILFALDDAPFRILGVDCAYPSLTARFRPAAPAERLPERSGAQWTLDLTLSPYAPVGSIGVPVVVRLDHPKQRRLVIPVTGFVRPMIAVTPPEADLGDLEPGRPVRVRLFVKNFAENAVRIASATSDIANAKLVVEPVEEGRTWNVVLEFPGGAAGTLVTGSVKLRTDAPLQPEIDVPVRGAFRGK